MKKKFEILLLAIATIAVINSCNKEYLIKVTGSLSGVVKDNTTGTYIKGAVVRVIAGSDSSKYMDSTDINGLYTITDIPLGDYQVLFSKKGYATIRSSITVQPVYEDGTSKTSSSKKQSYSVGIIEDASLSPLIGKAFGLITYYNAPAVGVTVKAYTDFENLIFTTTTDSSGYYSFTGLPLADYITFTSSSNNASGSATAYIGIGTDVQPRDVNTIDLTENSLTLLSYTGEGTDVLVDTSANIELIFSENVSEAITEKLGGYIRLTNGFTTVAAEVTYSNNKIIINPIGSLNVGSSYTVDLKVYASEVKSYSGSFYFSTVDRALGTITGPTTIAINQVVGTFYLQVTIKPVSTSIINYDIYAQKPGDNDFLLLGSSDMTGDGYNIDDDYLFPIGTKFYVVPYINFNGVVYGTPSNISGAKP